MQHFSRYIRSLEEGEEQAITRRDKLLARRVPMTAERQLSPQQTAALERVRERMRRGQDLGASMPSRDALHQR